ncbi:MAG: hypothetical protein JOY96_09405 [Verrucomicrobia bacterium]|nr:hypothetical protein [Verrucomicrobiota bacterium]
MAFQTAAWIGMLVKYSKAEGVEVGISKTFDGKHPCSLCLSIAKNKQTDKRQSSQSAASKIFLLAESQGLTLKPPGHFWYSETSKDFLFSYNGDPPVPPPRIS